MQHDLPDGVFGWLSHVGGGSVTRLERAVARREAWIVDVTRPDGSVLEGFLRLDRAPRTDDPWSVQKEADIVRALRDTPVPVAQVHASSREPSCVLFERLSGRADLQNADPAQQRAVMGHFMDLLAELHSLDIDYLPLPPMPRPKTPHECALGEVDLVLAYWSQFLSGYRDPLLTFGIDWLRRHAPTRVERVCLVQGDTGPVNFMFQGDRVTALFDFEWAHLGDPLEDLGNICVREFWNPCGGLDGLFERYEEASGIRVDLDSVRYYRVQQQMRGMVPCHFMTIRAKPHEPLAWALAYRHVGDRATCEALADAMGVELSVPDLPPEDERRDPLAEAASWALIHDIAPATTTALARARSGDVDVMVRCMERVARYGRQIESVECQELAALLGGAPSDLQAGLDALDALIAARSIDETDALQYLARRAYRLEWLYRPCTALYPDRKWAPLPKCTASARTAGLRP
jgi:aminoglycoside phosphotransferase (APT) family kinase protein